MLLRVDSEHIVTRVYELLLLYVSHRCGFLPWDQYLSCSDTRETLDIMLEWFEYRPIAVPK
jgi:hypothetical protein